MRELLAAKRPLILGIGGGGDVVGALALAEHMRIYHGSDPIVGGRRTVHLSAIATVTFLFEIPEALASAARLALAVRDAANLDDANRILGSLGVRSELDWERETASDTAPNAD